MCRYNRTINQWEAVGGGLPSTGIVTSVIIDGRRCFVGTRGGGVFVSNDAGASWQSLISGLSANDIYALWLNGGAIFAGANLGGVYGAPLSSGNFVAYSQSVTVNQNTPRGVILGGTDFSLNPLTYSVLFQPNNGTLSGTAPNLVYTPATNFVGSDAFIFRINNGATNSASATVYVTVSPSTTPPSNAPPVANSQSISTNSGTARAVILSASDVNGDALAYSVVAPPANGILSRAAPNLTYTPTAGFSGSDSFSFKANDGKADSNIATVSISVLANRAPVVNVPGAQIIAVGQPLNFIVSGSDLDAGQVLTLMVTNAPIGAIFNALTGQFTWTPLASQVGSSLVSFTVTDNGLPQLSDTKTVSITVPNRAPVITVPSAQSTSTGQLITFAVSATDPDTNQILTLSATNLPSGASFTAATGVFAWTPSAVGISTVSFTVTDNGNPPLSDTKTVNISVTGNSPNGNWTNISGGLPSNPQSIAALGTEIFVGTTANGVYKSSNGGQSWVASNSGITTTGIISISEVNGNLYAAGNFVLYYSNDGGASWSSISSGLSGSVNSVTQAGTKLLAATTNGVYSSSNNGASWVLSSSGLPTLTAQTSPAARALLTVGADVYVAGQPSGVQQVFKSSDNGATWASASSGLLAGFGFGTAVNALVANGSNIYAATAVGIYVTSNGGTSWTAVAGGLPTTSNNALSLAASGNNIFAGYIFNTNVYASTNSGTSWSAMNVGATVTYVRGIVVIGNKVYCWASPDGFSSGIYVSPIPGT